MQLTSDVPTPSRRAVHLAILGFAVLLLAGLAWWLSGEDTVDPSPLSQVQSTDEQEPSGSGGSKGSRLGAAAAAAGKDADGGAGQATSEQGRVVIAAGWGSALGQLGRERPEEGNPEGPMAFTFDQNGNPVVLDQVNQRIVRYSKDGKALSAIPTTLQAPQDILVAPDGTMAVLDRLVDKSVALLDKDGRLLGELPIEGPGIEEPGGVTGIFQDGNDLCVEYENGPCIKIGSLDGKAATEREELPGRPGASLYCGATMVDPTPGANDAALVFCTPRGANEPRFTRQYRFGAPLMRIAFLEEDPRGTTIYFVVETLMPSPTGEPPKAGEEGKEPEGEWVMQMICLSPQDGSPMSVTPVHLPPQTMPEETFRPFKVMPGGGVSYQVMTEAGVSIQEWHCQ